MAPNTLACNQLATLGLKELSKNFMRQNIMQGLAWRAAPHGLTSLFEARATLVNG